MSKFLSPGTQWGLFGATILIAGAASFAIASCTQKQCDEIDSLLAVDGTIYKWDGFPNFRKMGRFLFSTGGIAENPNIHGTIDVRQYECTAYDTEACPQQNGTPREVRNTTCNPQFINVDWTYCGTPPPGT